MFTSKQEQLCPQTSELAKCVLDFPCGGLQKHQPYTSVDSCDSHECLVALIKHGNVKMELGTASDSQIKQRYLSRNVQVKGFNIELLTELYSK